MPADDPDELIRTELRRLARLSPDSGRAAQAKATALRALLRLDGPAGRELTEAERHLWDEGRDPKEQVDDLDWHPDPDDPFADLDVVETVGARRRWWLALAGAPPPRTPP
jgi:hypothetical protein